MARRDTELATRAGQVRELDAQVAVIRTRAEAIDGFFVSYPDEETQRRETAATAENELTRRRDELAVAERELATARDPESRERAASAVTRARDHVHVAEVRLDRARAAAAELEREASDLTVEVPQLEARARAIAARVDGVPPAPTGVRELVEWASRAHAELFVAAGQLDAQRDRVIREANELATMLLGEPTYGSTVAQLAERVLPLARE
jgi:chromosome segregation ATPase